jgi:hypothetical protein
MGGRTTAEMIIEGKEPNQLLNQPPQVRPKTAVSFTQRPGHDGRGGAWKGEWRQGGDTCTGIIASNTDMLKGKF